MIRIGITSKLQSKLNVEIQHDNTFNIEPFYSWHAHCFQDSRRTGVIFMNDLTRYCVILFGLKKSDLLNLNQLFVEQLKENMIINGYSTIHINSYLAHTANFTFTKTTSRSILGSINDCLYLLPHWKDTPSLDYDEINYLNARFNNMPMLPLKKVGLETFPELAMKQSLIAMFGL